MPIENFTYSTIALADDYEGKVEATFISSDKNVIGQVPILYLHGFVDYFFHPHLADQFHTNGYNFYALELRKYGHSLKEHQHPNYCKNLEEYFEEISIALERIHKLDGQKIIFLGHSTGGLIGSIYASKGERRDLIRALILNSPFLEINAPGLVRKLSGPVMKLAVKANVFANLPNALSPLYPKSIHIDHQGEWDFDLSYKPIKGFPAYFMWLLAIKSAQDELKQGLSIDVPVLLLHSSDSFLPSKWSERIHRSDVVLNVEDMKDLAHHLGSQVECIEIEDARHDVFLSLENVREKAFSQLFDWLSKHS